MTKLVVPPTFASYVFFSQLLDVPVGTLSQKDLERVLVVAALATLFSGFLVVAYYVSALNAAKLALEIAHATTDDWKEQHTLALAERRKVELEREGLVMRVKELEAQPNYEALLKQILDLEKKIDQTVADAFSNLLEQMREERL